MSWIPQGLTLQCFIGLQSGIIVVSAMNPIHRMALQIVVYLIGSQIFILQDFYFLGQTYIIVYVGAIAILFLFVIMMVNIPEKNNVAHKNKISYYQTLGIAIQLSVLVFSNQMWNNDAIYQPFYPNWATEFKYMTDIQTLSIMTYLVYPLSQLQIGMILWIVLIGIITITHSV